MDYKKLLETAINAAKEGGRAALEHQKKPGPIRWKGSQDIVTPGTLEVQSRILEIIRATYPDHAILSEELDETPDPEAEALWIVDPIDGSINYMQGIPFFSVSIGFRDKGIYRLGVVYDPIRDELFHAVRRRGAFLNGRSVITNKRFDGMEAYNVAVVGTDWTSQALKRSEQAKILEQMAGHVVSIQIMGSPALALCYIAAGRLDAYFHLQLKLWDWAAGFVILEEGGGVFTNIHGSAWQHSDGGYLATNGVIHGKMLAPIKFVIGEQPGPSGF